jgi:hypothetical protein
VKENLLARGPDKILAAVYAVDCAILKLAIRLNDVCPGICHDTPSHARQRLRIGFVRMKNP